MKCKLFLTLYQSQTQVYNYFKPKEKLNSIPWIAARQITQIQDFINPE